MFLFPYFLSNIFFVFQYPMKDTAIILVIKIILFKKHDLGYHKKTKTTVFISFHSFTTYRVFFIYHCTLQVMLLPKSDSQITSPSGFFYKYE